ncbi:MAG: hypothetical protein Kow0069_10840 [Promethearchaeota archaeon]
MSEEQETPKKKFVFKCTKCGTCCNRGPIPLTARDLAAWARAGVVANFLPRVDLVEAPGGTTDLAFKPLEGGKCPFFNAETKECAAYDLRPLACRSFPLEHDGTRFYLSEIDCPGVGQGPMSKEELREIREDARVFHQDLTNFRAALPIVASVVQQRFIVELMKQNEEAMSRLSEEDRRKMEEISKKLGGT